MPIDMCPNKKCGKMIDIDGYVEHGVPTLFYCECGHIYDMPEFMRLIEVSKEEVNLSDVKNYPLSTPHCDNRGLFINKTRWSKPSLSPWDFASATSKGKVEGKQTIGIVEVDKEPISFKAGVFEGVGIIPFVKSGKDSKPPVVNVNLSSYIEYLPSVDNKLFNNIGNYEISFEGSNAATVCQSKGFFLNYLNDLMKKIKPKKELTPFITDLNRVGW